MKKFELVKTFILQVSDNFVHKTYLDSKQGSPVKGIDVWNTWEITDHNFRKVSTQLKAGQTLQVEIFKGIGLQSSEECIQFLKENNALLVGAQGAGLVLELKREEIPNDSNCYSFDEEYHLFQEFRHGRLMDYFIPFVSRRYGNHYVFEVERIKHVYITGNKSVHHTPAEYLLCFKLIS